MLFNSLHFLIFLPLVTALYYLLRQPYRWILVFIASCYFYMAFVPHYILILFFIILVDYFSAIVIERNQGRKRKIFLVLSLLSNIALLAFFKYFNFLNENLSAVFSMFGQEFKPFNLDIILPIGLSFHTFQSMAYTIEVYRGRQKAERHLGYFSNYVLFFPQMVAGPIERYDGLGRELKEPHQPRYENFADGFRLILFGLFVKMSVADNIAPFVNSVYADPLAATPYEAWLAVFLFSFQIYADFFGYSTIALGSARLLGVRIMDNFRTPYLSLSVSEFWNRWHISLSTWFRDYLYIPLGGNRVKLPRWSLNIMIVFMVSGLWHGASWTFVVWGALHGIMLLLERYFSRITGFTASAAGVWIKLLLGIKTFVVCSFIWIFFRATDFANAWQMIRTLFSGPADGSDLASAVTPVIFALVLVFFDALLYSSRFDLRIGAMKPVFRWSFYTFLVFCLFALSGTQKFAFIYFQF